MLLVAMQRTPSEWGQLPLSDRVFMEQMARRMATEYGVTPLGTQTDPDETQSE